MFEKVEELAGEANDAVERVESRSTMAKAQAQALAIALFAKLGLSGEWFSAVQNPFDPFAQANRGQMAGADVAVRLVVALVVGGLMAAFLLPIAINEIATVDTASWTSGAASLWEILPVMIVLAIFLFFVGIAVSGRF